MVMVMVMVRVRVGALLRDRCRGHASLLPLIGQSLGEPSGTTPRGQSSHTSKVRIRIYVAGLNVSVMDGVMDDL